MDQLQFPNIISTLKRVLKARRITYRDIAKKIGASESGLKKVVSGNDCSIGKLIEICQAVDIPFAELVAASAQAAGFETVTVPEHQQEFFLQNPDYFHFFWRLAYERLPMAEIARRHDISPRQLIRYLKKLDEFGLIEWHAGDRVRFPIQRMVNWDRQGPLMRHIMTHWSRRLIDLVIANLDKQDRLYHLRYLRLTKESYADLLRAERDLHREFSARSVREIEVNDRKNLIDVGMLVAVSPTSFIDLAPADDV